MLPIEAFRKVTGKKRAGDGTQSTRLFKKVESRVSAIQRASETETTLTIREKRELYAMVVRTPIGQIDENSILCGSVKRTTTESGGSIEYKTLDKLKATELDTELAGHIQPRGNGVTVNVGVNISAERQRELFEKKKAAIERRKSIKVLTNGTNGHS